MRNLKIYIECIYKIPEYIWIKIQKILLCLLTLGTVDLFHLSYMLGLLTHIK